MESAAVIIRSFSDWLDIKLTMTTIQAHKRQRKLVKVDINALFVFHFEKEL